MQVLASSHNRTQVKNGFEEHWKEYKRARNTFFLLSEAYVPMCFGIAVASMKLSHSFTPGFVAASIWMARLLVSGTRVNLWRFFPDRLDLKDDHRNT